MHKDQQTPLRRLKADVIVEDDGPAYPYTLGLADAEVEAKMARENEGFVLKSGELLTASGHRFYALMALDATSSYENHGCTVAVPNDAAELEGEDPADRFRLYEQGEPDFYSWIARAKASDPGFEFFPYRYRYFDVSDAERDHHAGDDGWSVV